MTNENRPTDPDAETLGMPEDGDSRKGSMPEPAVFSSQGIPAEIGRYRILGVIGSGGMGTIYEAMQESPRRRVALKVVKAGAASEMALRRFEFESQTLAKLRHPNIAQVYEAGTWESDQGPVPYFAMEYIPNAQSIIQYARKRNLSLRERMELFIQVCEAVHHAHQKGIIHRDLKPDNILVDSTGVIKIIDFGVARATDADMAVTTMQTTMGQLIGTLQYMSPEQCEANPDAIDTRSDVYALGVIFFQLLSGELPYNLRRQAIHEAVRVIQEVRPDSMSTTNLQLRGDIETIALKALEKDRQRRYQSASDLAQDIHHYLHNEPIEARPLSIAYQVRLFSKKYKRTVAAVLALVASIILGLIGTSWGLIRVNTLNSELALALDEATTQRMIAEKRFEDVRDLSRTFVGPFYDGVVKLNAAMDVRRLVIDTALSHQRDLQQSAGNDPELLADIAYTLGRLGDMLGGRAGASLGLHDEAIEQYKGSLDIYLTLVERGHDRKYEVAHAYIRIGEANNRKKAYPVAMEYYQSASTVAHDLLSEKPDDMKVRRLPLAIAMNIGDMHRKLGNPEEAASMFRTMLEGRRQLLAEDPSNLRLRRDVMTALTREATALEEGGDAEAALALHEESYSVAASLVQDEPENGWAKRDLAFRCFYLGSAQIHTGTAEAGFALLEEGMEMIRTLCAASPEDSRARGDVLLYLRNMVELQRSGGRADEAQVSCRRTLMVLQPVVEANPDNYVLQDIFRQVEDLLGTVRATVDPV
jgi:serine/threonine protein kinase